MNFGTTSIGTCSICGGRVSVPSIWMGVMPPTPTCEGCGATKLEYGPVVDMRPAQQTYTGNSITINKRNP